MSVAAPAYQAHPRHRDGTPEKSQWTISEQDEYACFDRAWSAGWITQEVGWGLHLVGNNIQYLGVSHDGAEALWWAKFVGRSTPWHGYPADLLRRPTQDQPALQVRRDWHNQGLISTATLSKLGRRQPCRPR